LSPSLLLILLLLLILILILLLLLLLLFLFTLCNYSTFRLKTCALSLLGFLLV
jgi:hypothetical protein